MVITFHTDDRFGVIIYRDARNSTTEAVEKFKWSYLLKRMFDLETYYIETLEIEQWNLSRNSNGHNCSHGFPILAHYIS